MNSRVPSAGYQTGDLGGNLSFPRSSDDDTNAKTVVYAEPRDVFGTCPDIRKKKKPVVCFTAIEKTDISHIASRGRVTVAGGKDGKVGH